MSDDAVALVVLMLVTAMSAAVVLVPTALLAGAGWLVWVSMGLQARVAALEKRLAAVSAGRIERAPEAAGAPLPPPPDDDEITEEVAAAPPAPEAPPTQAPPVAAPTPPRRPSFELPSPERVVMWIAAALGGTTLVLAVLLGLAVVIERGWLGPAVRVAGGLAAGSLLWLVGAFLRRRLPVLGAALSGVAIGVLYGTLYAANGLYELIGTTTTFASMIAVTLVATATAARDGDRFTGHLALIGGLLTPVLVSTGENHPVGLFSYLALLLGGVLWAARRHGWWDVAAVAALGAAGLHVGWAVSWYAADQVPPALVGALLLTVPFAVAATARQIPLRVVGFAAAAALPLVALPWVIPVDPTFYDPRSGLVVVQPLAGAAWWVAAALAWLFAPAWLASRGHGHPFGAALASLMAGALGLLALTSWALQDAPPVALVALFVVGPLVVGTLALARSAKAAPGLSPVPAAAGVGLAGLAVAAPDSSPVAVGLGITALVLFGWIAALSRSGVVLWAVGFGAAVALGFAAPWFEGADRGWVVGPALLTLGVLGVLPLVRRWPGDPRGPRAAAALVWPATFPALHVLWRDGWGEGAIGALPVLLGAGALLGATTLVRRERVDRSDPSLALFVAVALLGVVGAVAVQLQEGWLTVVWALEAAALGLLARWMGHPLVRWSAVLLGVTVAVRLLLNPWALGYGDASGWPILNWTLYTWGIPFLALLVLANGLPRRGDLLDWSIPVVRVLALLVGFALVEVEVAHAFQDAGPVELGGHGLWQGMVRSVSWATYGLGVLLAGLATDRREVRFLGFSFILLATAKVFAVDLWSLSGFVRVGSVGALGASLLVAAFLFERLVLRSHAKEKRP